MAVARGLGVLLLRSVELGSSLGCRETSYVESYSKETLPSRIEARLGIVELSRIWIELFEGPALASLLASEMFGGMLCLMT